MRNNNTAVIRRLTSQSLKANKRRNVYVVLAIALTTLLLTSLFSIGIGYIASYEMQQIRLMGTTAHAAVSRPTASQLQMLNSLSYVELVGTGNHVATLNRIPEMKDMTLTLYYYGTPQWEEMRAPAFTDIVGSYPDEENEIMMPTWILERLGITPEIGKEINLSYSVEMDGDPVLYNKTFVLSGWFESYMHVRSGNMDSILVSKAFSDSYGKTPQTDGSALVIFDDSTKVNEYCERLITDLGISDINDVRPVPMYDMGSSGISTILIATVCVVAFIILTGYLLVYNVLYISVVKDVRFYGLLKTIGVTPRQIRKIITGQILQLCIIGIPIGAGIAAALSLLIVPALVAYISDISDTGAVVSFSPVIFVGSAFFALVTAFWGALKPGKKAAGVSPVEAQKYTGVVIRKKHVHSSTRGKAHKMAIRNIFRDRKRAAIVFLSLFLGITVFITISTLVSSLDTDNYIASYVLNDFILTNNTATIGYQGELKQKFDDEFLFSINQIPGFESMRFDTIGDFHLTYTDGFNRHLQEIHPNISKDDYASVEKNFYSIVVGVDANALSEIDADLDAEAFARGEYLLIAANDPWLYQSIDSIELRSVEDGEVLGSIPVGGFAPMSFHNDGFGTAPTLIMSNALLERLTGEALRSRLYIDVQDGYEKQFLESLIAFTDEDREISRKSRLEAVEKFRDGKIIMFALGGGAALVLALIGVLNFVNIMSVGIVVRKKEIVTMESIGMSKKQMRKMLIYEGLGYGIIALMLAATIGSVITYGVFQLFKNEADYAVFTYPYGVVLVIFILVLTICVITPEKVYRSINKQTIVERLREAE